MDLTDEIDKWTIQLRKGALELVLLSALADTPRYGFALIGEIQRRAGLEMPEGTIYPLLIRLSKDGLIEASWRETEAGGQPRKYYDLTARGRAMLSRMAAGWRDLARAVDAMIGDVK